MTVVVVEHPLSQVNLTVLRDEKTDAQTFRRALETCVRIVVLEATKTILTAPISEVNLALKEYHLIQSRRLGLAPILRSGLGMQSIALEMLPSAKVYHIGLFRDETTLEPVEYYSKLPKDLTVDCIFILDPLMATGGTAVAAIDMLEQWGLNQSQIKLVSIISSKPALERIRELKPGVEITTCAVDPSLTDKGLIVPGCGDVGNRYFGL